MYTTIERLHSDKSEEIMDKLNEVIDILNGDLDIQTEPNSMPISLVDELDETSTNADIVDTINAILIYLTEQEESR